MGFRDRQYYREGGSGYLGGPLSILGFSAPFGTWFGVRVRLHLWMLVSMFFVVLGYASSKNLLMLLVHLALLVAAVMLHEFGRRIAARAVGGFHEEFMLWPPGGMTQPQIPERPGSMTLTYAAGIAMNLLLAGLCFGGLALMGLMPALRLGAVLGALGGSPVASATGSFLESILGLFLLLNIGVAVAAILPYYWFDGGPLLESIIWRFTTRRKAISITCIVGMVLAVPMILLSLMAGVGGFIGVLFWGLLFYSSYSRRKQLAYEYSNDFEAEIAASASYRGEPMRRRRPGMLARWLTQRKVAREQEEQAAVDQILEKVAQHGMHSLTNAEKKILQRASERLRTERRM